MNEERYTEFARYVVGVARVGIWVSIALALLLGAMIGFALGGLCPDRNDDALVTPSAVVPVHFGTTYTMSCVCQNYPTANPHHVPAPPEDTSGGLQPVEQWLAGDHEVVVVGFGP